MTVRAGCFLIAVAFPTLVHAQSIGFADLPSAQLSFPGFAIDEIGKDVQVAELKVDRIPDIGEGTNTFCLIQGPGGATCGTPVTFTATSPVNPTSVFTATFSLISNTAGASFLGPNSCVNVSSCSVVVTAAQPGSVVVRVILDFGGGVLKTCQVTLLVSGGGPPSIQCPPVITVPCPGPIDPSVTGTPTLSNSCGPVTTSFVDTVTGSNCAGPITSRAWTAMNAQGQSATCSQTISRSSVPSITCPTSITVPCFAQVPPPNISSVTASDGCGGPVTVTHVGDSAMNGTSGSNNVITRTYRATNGCGVQAICTQTITVNDTVPPSITCPTAVSVQCFAQVPAPNIAAVTASDSCGGPVTIAHLGDSATNGTSSSNNVITRTYSATDAAGNQNTCTQTIMVNDTTPPSITCPTAVSVQCFSQVPAPNIAAVTASDSCGGTVTIAHLGDSATNGTSSSNNVITRTYSATDSAGNQNSCTQTITVNDTVPPSITCPGPATVQCFSQVPAPNIAAVTASDGCGGQVTITHLGDSTTNGTSSCTNVITRTYSAIDSAGNQNSCTQTITVSDTTRPSITCPAAVSVQCFSAVPAPNIGLVTATDNCGGPVTVTHAGDAATNGTSSCNNVITRTYSAIDSCGNQFSCTQTITINDTTPPSISCPGPANVQCFSAVPAPNIGLLTASDNCGGPVTITHVGDSATNGTASCNNVITRTYSATDSCGNVNTCSQTITVNDTTPPSISCPGPANVQCFSAVSAPNIGLVTASDNCGGPVTIAHMGDSATNGTASCNNVITRTYSATDSCGNVNTCSQTITVNDTTPPSITCPGPATAQCFSAVSAPNIGLVTASDNCGGPVTIAHMSDSATNGTASCNNVITRTYSATDSCGNVNTCTQTITINDTTPPSISCPGPANVQCFSAVPAPNIGLLTASDNCGGPVTITHVGDSATNGTASCNNVITRTYSATDSCGNQFSCTQTITVNDTTPPSITCPSAVSVQCFSQVPAPNITAVTAANNCGGPVTVTHAGDAASNGTSSCNNVITRTYQAVDGCGNVNTCTQTITVNDTTPPVITCPAAFTAACGSPTDPGLTGTATATDNCNPAPVISFTDLVVGTCPAGQVITRTWTASDGCQSVSCPQVITLTAPETGCVFDRGGGCGAPTQAVLTAEFHPFSITPKITGADPNAQLVLLAQLPPYGPATSLTSSCTLHVSPTSPPTLLVGTFQTDRVGSWTNTFNVPAFPSQFRALLQAFVSTPTPGPLGSVTLTRALDARRPCPCTVPNSFIQFEFDDVGIAANRTIWFSAVLKPKRFPTTGATLRFHASRIAFVATTLPYLVTVPPSLIVWDPAATIAETHFDVGTGEWRTTVPADYDDEVFLSGVGFPVTVALPGEIDPMTWFGTFSTDVADADFEWKWAAAVYAIFTTDPNAIGVKPVEGGSVSIFSNADHAGTPENYKSFVIPGGTGSGESNYTGSYSSKKRTGCNNVINVFSSE